MLAVLGTMLLGLALAQDSVKATGRGRTLTLNVDGIHHAYTLSEARVGVDMNHARVLEFQRKDGLRYVLLDIDGPSRRNGGARQCGAGSESSLVWLRLQGWRLLEVQSVKYESCWSSITYAVPARRGTLYTISFSDFTTMKDKTVTFDRAHPELGLVSTGHPMPPTK